MRIPSRIKVSGILNRVGCGAMERRACLAVTSDQWPGRLTPSPGLEERGRGTKCPALHPDCLRIWRGLLGRLLGAIGCATALALARVFAFATVVTRLAATFTLAGVLPLASVLFFDLLVVLLVLTQVLALVLRARGSLEGRKQSRGLDGGPAAGD